jgi:hypothetical protein
LNLSQLEIVRDGMNRLKADRLQFVDGAGMESRQVADVVDRVRALIRVKVGLTHTYNNFNVRPETANPL